jgi:hypothetical protein
LPLAGATEGRAGVAANDEIKASSKSFRREGPQVRPQSLDSQFTLFSLSNQVRQGVGFDLHCNDSKSIRQCAGQPDFETAVAGAKRENRDVFGISHIHFLSQSVARVDCVRFKSHLLKTPFCHIHKLNRDSNSVKDDLRICDTV